MRTQTREIEFRDGRKQKIEFWQDVQASIFAIVDARDNAEAMFKETGNEMFKGMAIAYNNSIKMLEDMISWYPSFIEVKDDAIISEEEARRRNAEKRRKKMEEEMSRKEAKSDGQKETGCERMEEGRRS